MQNILTEFEYELKSQIIKNRGEHFQEKKMTNEDLETKIFQTPILNSNQAVSYGYIDSLISIHIIASLTRFIHWISCYMKDIMELRLLKL